MNESEPVTASTLRAESDGAGIGFCYDVDRKLFGAPGDHGPVVIGWDTNVVIDLYLYGAAVIDGEELSGVDAEYAADLFALGDLIDLWLIRDLRFVVLPRGFDDFRGKRSARFERAHEVMEALADALTFQLYDWGTEDHRFPDAPTFVPPDLSAFPPGADRKLVEQAVQFDVDVFMTRDRRVLRGGATLNRPQVLRPVELVAWLRRLGVGHFAGGLLDHSDCMYVDYPPAGDLGKLGALFAALNHDDD